MSRASLRLRRIFERRYHVALFLVAVAATLSFAASYRMAMIESDRAHAVVLAAEQRAHSQRIAFLIADLDKAEDPAAADRVRTELLSTIEAMRRAHEILSGAAPESAELTRFIAPLEGIYEGGFIPFDTEVRRFLEDSEAIAFTSRFSPDWLAAKMRRDSIVEAATASMMQTHGLMLRILEAEAAADVRLAKAVEVSFWVAILLLLLVITLTIFRPMSHEIERAFLAVEGARTKAKRAEETAFAATEAKGHFFQAASHELKTPLNAILGMADSMRTKAGDQYSVELEHMTAAGDHLLALLNNILDTQRLVDGTFKLKEDPFNLYDSLDRPCRLARKLAEQKGLSFKSDLKVPHFLNVIGDSTRMEQVLVNLLDNAIKFTPEGHVAVEASVDLQAEDFAGLTVKIADSGIGIPPDKIERIFERYSAEGSMLARSGGLGVGLALAKEIVTHMGGTMDVKSKLGKGTVFYIGLPLDRSEDSGVAPQGIAPSRAEDEPPTEDTARAAAALDHEEEAAVPRRSFDVLIVDDNLANRMVAEALVKPIGGRPVTAVDGREAVKVAGDRKFDIILMDLSMPVMDGIQATSMIRGGTGPNRQTPILAVTAHAAENDFADLKAVGFQDLISKPVRKDVLTRSIEKWTARRPALTEIVS